MTDNIIAAHTVTIENGASMSDAVRLNKMDSVKLGGLRLFGIVIPSAWTAANLTFQTSYDGVTYQNLYDKDGSEETVTVTDTDTSIWLNPATFAAVPFLKIRSGTSGTPVNQAAARDILLVLRSV